MLKRCILILVILGMLLSFSACSKTSPETQEIAAELVGATFKGKVEFDLGNDWNVVWVFGEDTVSVTKDYNLNNGEHVSYTAEYNYTVTGTREDAMVVFPDSHAWNDLIIGIADNGKITLLYHQDTVGLSTFHLEESVTAVN